ncbi:MAG: hypothetical protein WBI07_13450 [Mobilitalea sp.]
MNQSYRLKMEDWINSNTLTAELLLICIAKLNPLIEDLVYKEKKYIHVNRLYGSGSVEHTQKKLIYSDIRKPMMDVLLRDYHMSFDTIVLKVKDIPEVKIPTIKVCQQVQEIIISGHYLIDKWCVPQRSFDSAARTAATQTLHRFFCFDY